DVPEGTGRGAQHQYLTTKGFDHQGDLEFLGQWPRPGTRSHYELIPLDEALRCSDRLDLATFHHQVLHGFHFPQGSSALLKHLEERATQARGPNLAGFR